MILEVVNTSVVNLKVDPSIILATKKDIEVLEHKMDKKIENIDIPVKSVNGQTGDVKLTAKDVGAETPSAAQDKANAALNSAKSYINQEVSSLAGIGRTNETVKSAYDLAQQAFQSASNGKILVARAITGKGIPTDPGDTFQNMANNINAIETDRTGDATAVAMDILLGKTAYARGNKLVGTMPNNGAIDRTITTQGGQITVPKGYHDGSGIVKAQLTNLIAGNIKKGVVVGGIKGTYDGESIKIEKKEYSNKTVINPVTFPFNIEKMIIFGENNRYSSGIVVTSFPWTGKLYVYDGSSRDSYLTRITVSGSAANFYFEHSGSSSFTDVFLEMFVIGR